LTPRPIRIAHRGDHRRAPENTLAAMLAAIEIPACDGVEFDVRASADGIPILLHDDTLERVQGRPERPADLTAAELGTLGVPTLEEILVALPHRAFLNVELKSDPGRVVVEILAAYRGADLHDAVISSFDPATLARIAGLAPAWRSWLNAWVLEPETVATAAEIGCRGVSVEYHALTPASMRLARAAGLEVAAWTVRRRPTFERMAKLGVVAICSEGAALDG
jgi:glycerophosphoryl diester phosphodiesterase